MVSSKALTAVSLVMPIQMLMISLSVGSGVGVNSLIARRLGAKRQREADQAASTALRIGVFNYAVFLLVGIFLAKPFMSSYTDDAAIFEGGLVYLRIITIGSLASMVEIQLEKVLQATGNMVGPMIISLSGAVTNLILDPILIFGLCGMPKMGVAGAALATVIGQFVAMFVAVFMIFKYEHDVEVKLRGFKLDWQVVKDIYGVGFPSIIMQSIGSVMLLGYNAILAASAAAVAVLGIYFKLQSFIFMPVFGLNNGITPIIAFNYGAQNRKRMVKTIKVSLITAFCLLFVGFACFEFIPQVLLGMFSASDDMLQIGVPALRIIGVHFLIAWFCIIVGTVFQALGKAVFSMIVSIMRQLVVLIPAAYILSKLGGLHAVWWAFPIAEVISFTVSTLFLIRINRTIISKIPDGSDVL